MADENNNNNGRNLNPASPNPRPAQRFPVDSGLLGTRVMRTREISLRILQDDNFDLNTRLNHSHLTLQILDGGSVTIYYMSDNHQKINHNVLQRLKSISIAK